MAVFSADDVPVGSREEYWRDVMAGLLGPLEPRGSPNVARNEVSVLLRECTGVVDPCTPPQFRTLRSIFALPSGYFRRAAQEFGAQ